MILFWMLLVVLNIIAIARIFMELAGLKKVLALLILGVFNVALVNDRVKLSSERFFPSFICLLVLLLVTDTEKWSVKVDDRDENAPES
jgi:hypothetical protein